jgi:hypothetical protein
MFEFQNAKRAYILGCESRPDGRPCPYRRLSRLAGRNVVVAP